MRFIAAGLVFSFHTFALFPFASQSAQAIPDALFGQAGYIGVTFFFVLSGFVLTWAVRPGDTTLAFWRKRFFKIYPTNLLTFLVALFLLTVVSNTANNGRNILLNLFLVQSWDNNLNVRISYNGVAWSLSCEALFYFCFPFLLKLINKIRPERLWLWAIISAASVISLPIFAKLLPPNQMFPEGYSQWQLWFVFHSPPTQMLVFIFGMLMAKIVIAGRRLPLKLGGAVALAVTAYFVTGVFPPLWQFSAVTVIPLGLLIAAGAVADVDRQKTFLGSRLMVWLGNISFAFYMWHYLVLVYGHHWLGAGQHWSTLTTIAVAILLLAVSLLLSWASFTFFERPIMQRFAAPRRKRDLADVGTIPDSLEQLPASPEAPVLVTTGPAGIE
jgi:mycarose O-acyltransferase